MVYAYLTALYLQIKQVFFADHSDPVTLCGMVIDQRIKGTPGITGL